MRDKSIDLLPPSVPISHVGVGIALVFFTAWAIFRVRAIYERWRRARRWRRAAAAETHASQLLQQHGYIVLESQLERSYELLVDGRSVSIGLRADYLVERNGQTFIAEVKSGKRAPLLETSATRRQLLEYHVAFQVDGVLLVDGETRRVHEVVFPMPAAQPERSSALIWTALGLVAIAALSWMLLDGKVEL